MRVSVRVNGGGSTAPERENKKPVCGPFDDGAVRGEVAGNGDRHQEPAPEAQCGGGGGAPPL